MQKCIEILYSKDIVSEPSREPCVRELKAQTPYIKSELYPEEKVLRS